MNSDAWTTYLLNQLLQDYGNCVVSELPLIFWVSEPIKDFQCKPFKMCNNFKGKWLSKVTVAVITFSFVLPQVYTKQISNQLHTSYMVPKLSMEPSELGQKNRSGHFTIRCHCHLSFCFIKGKDREAFLSDRPFWNMKTSFQRTWNHRS